MRTWDGGPKGVSTGSWVMASLCRLRLLRSPSTSVSQESNGPADCLWHSLDPGTTSCCSGCHQRSMWPQRRRSSSSISNSTTVHKHRLLLVLCSRALRLARNRSSVTNFLTRLARQPRLTVSAMISARVEAAAHAPADRFSIMPILNRKKKRCEELKVILLGDNGVGKTSLVAALAQSETSHDSAGVDFHVKMATLNDEIVKVQLWDTADQEKFGVDALPKSYFRRARGVFLMYDVTRRDSFRNVVQWALQLQALVNSSEPLGLVLVANGRLTKAGVREEVSVAEGRALAAMLSCHFVNYSSSGSAEACFDALIDELSTKKPWEASLIDAATRLQAIEAYAETEKEAVAAASETESEDGDALDFDSHDTAVVEPTTPPQTHSGVNHFAAVTHRRASHFFTTLELGLVSSKKANIAGLPTGRELVRAALPLACMLLLLWPFVLILLLQAEPSDDLRLAQFAGVVGRLLGRALAP